MQSVKLIKYFARTLPGSFAEKEYSLLSKDEVKGFKERVVFDDLTRQFLKLFERSFDFLVMDFGSASYTSLFKADDAVGTLSRYALNILREKNLEYKIIPCWSDEYLKLHHRGMEALVKLVSEKKIERKIIINKIYAVTALNGGGAELDSSKAAIFNERLDCIYDYIVETLPGVRFINYPEELFVGDVGHKWGAGFFHYTQEFYQHQEKELLSIFTADDHA